MRWVSKSWVLRRVDGRDSYGCAMAVSEDVTDVRLVHLDVLSSICLLVMIGFQTGKPVCLHHRRTVINLTFSMIFDFGHRI